MCMGDYGEQVVEGRDKVIDALCAEVAALRSQVPPAEVVSALRWISAGLSEEGSFAVCNINGADLEDYEVAEWQEALQEIDDWLATLPTQEAQP